MINDVHTSLLMYIPLDSDPTFDVLNALIFPNCRIYLSLGFSTIASMVYTPYIEPATFPDLYLKK